MDDCERCWQGYGLEKTEVETLVCTQEAFTCPHFTHAVNGTCQENQCYCNGGNRKRNCYQDGMESCGSCREYFMLTDIDESVGRAKTCSLSCPEFYHQADNKNTCIKNQCSCENGRRHDHCPIDGSERCSSCNRFFELDNSTDTCVLSCPSGFRPTPDGTYCQKNHCHCTGGIATANCPWNGAESCHSCFSDYEAKIDEKSGFKKCQLACGEFRHIQEIEVVNQATNETEISSSCQTNRCHCANGITLEGCRNHGDEQCASCFQGYDEAWEYNSDGSKIENSLNCVLNCPKNHHLSPEGTHCNQNICTCSNGQVDFNNCFQNNMEACEICYYGYTRNHVISSLGETGTCEKNICTCSHGTAKILCDGKNIGDSCDVCDDGYRLDGENCVFDHFIDIPLDTELER